MPSKSKEARSTKPSRRRSKEVSIRTVRTELAGVKAEIESRRHGLSERSMAELCEKVEAAISTLSEIRQVVEMLDLGFPASQVGARLGVERGGLTPFVKPLKRLSKPPLFAPQGENSTRATRHAGGFTQLLTRAIAILDEALDERCCSLVVGAWPSLTATFMPAVYEKMGIGSGAFFDDFPKVELQTVLIEDHVDVASVLGNKQFDIALCDVEGWLDKRISKHLTAELVLKGEPVGLLIPKKPLLGPADNASRERWNDLVAWCRARGTKRNGPFDPRWLSAVTFFDYGGWDLQHLAKCGESLSRYLTRRITVATTREQLECVITHQLGITIGHEPKPSDASRVFFVPIREIVYEQEETGDKELRKFEQGPFSVYLIFRKSDKRYLSEEEGGASTYGKLFRRLVESIKAVSQAGTWRAS
jgi:hypothetical protein